MEIIAADGVRVPFIFGHSSGPKRGLVILAHGITSEKTEEGLFTGAAAALRTIGYSTLQFDYRGHGESTVPSSNMTIGGEVLDLEAVFRTADSGERLFLISSSFAAVSACLMDVDLKRKLSAWVLWNPVLSIEKTFIQPELAWQIKNFGREQVGKGIASGQLLIDDRFPVGMAFLEELETCQPQERLYEFECPIAILHGDQDTYVSHRIAKKTARSLAPQATFFSIHGADHGFHRAHESRELIDLTGKFIASSAAE